MIVELPPAEERKALLSAQAHRYPEMFWFTVSDGDGKVDLPVLLGLPSGACKMPMGQQGSDDWARATAAAFGKGDFDNTALVEDCVLWPAPTVWAQWIARWPALHIPVGSQLRRKYGGALSQFRAPRKDETPPDAIAEALRRNPSAIWRRFRPDGHELDIDLAVAPPDLTAWRMFEGERERPGVNHWALVLDMATASTVTSTVPVADLFSRWCGLALTVTLAVSNLAGVAAEVRRGEF